MNWLWMSLYHALGMLWMTFWALVLGFGISAGLQVLVSKERMSRAFGRTSLKSVAAATGFGAASSSCSYAAAAAARSAIQQGAAVVPALAFMFASTNLVIELGVVLWILMGWRFVLAEFTGAFVLIALVWAQVKFIVPRSVIEDLKQHAQRGAGGGGGHSCHGDGHEHNHEHGDAKKGGKWAALAHAFIMDWSMMWKELLGGFVIAGFIATLIPPSWWQTLFLKSGPAPLRLIENAIVGPIIAILSFVCSVGNIPLASHFWSSGISFGGVIAFIYADLLVVPLIIIYGKYYGARATAWLCGIFFVGMVTAGIVVDLIFNALGLIPTGPRPPSAVSHEMIKWNYTSWLDIIAVV
ncbi:MAG: permease, partial [Verrucomicrobiota bacterium]|nr:permease [Verrucomicrobiota bacterium]